jgi:hypothetical protein
VTATSSPVGTESRSPAGEWSRVGSVAGYTAAAAFLAGTVLFLLDAAGLLGAVPAPGQLATRQARFYTAYFTHQQDIAWDIIARDTVFPVAFLALIVAALAIRARAGAASPEGQLVVTSFTVGGILAILADLTFLAAVEYWRYTGLQAGGTAGAGRMLDGIQVLTHWPEAFGFAILAGGCVALARLWPGHRGLASVPTLACTEAVLLLGIGVTGVIPYDIGYDLLSLAAGAIVGPALGICLARALGQPQPPAI